MKFVIVIDLDETLGHFENNRFLVRPFAYTLLDFFVVANMDIFVFSYGADHYVEHVINENFDIFNSEYKTCVYGRTVCEISKRKFDYYKCSKIVRKKYFEDVMLIGIDDQVKKNMDSGYDCRIHVEPYLKEDKNDDELYKIMLKIIEYCKNVVLAPTS